MRPITLMAQSRLILEYNPRYTAAKILHLIYMTITHIFQKKANSNKMHLSSTAGKKALKFTCANTNQTLEFQQKDGAGAVIADSNCTIICETNSEYGHTGKMYVSDRSENLARSHVPHDYLTADMSDQKPRAIVIQANK